MNIVVDYIFDIIIYGHGMVLFCFCFCLWSHMVHKVYEYLLDTGMGIII